MKSNMKIVILSDDFPPKSFGGAGIIASNLARALFNRGHDVTVITVTDDRKNVGVSKDGGVTIHRLYSSYNLRFRSYMSLCNPQLVKEVGDMLRKVSPDVVHAHNIHTYISYASLKEARKYSKSVFLTVHDVMSVHYGKLGADVDPKGNIILDTISPWKQISQYRFYYNPFRNIVIKYYLKSVDRIFSVSGALKEVLEKKGIYNIEVLHNGIDVSNWKIEPEALADFKRLHNLGDKRVLFFGGRLSGSKGANVAVEVLSNVSEKIKNVVLLVAGEKNKAFDHILKKAEELGVKERVVFTGWLDHDSIRYAYASSEAVLVLSQYVDPFPTVNLEAMATERPIIGTIFGGTTEVVLDAVTGFLVNPRSIEYISAKVIELLSSIELSGKFGQAGFERVSNDFSEDAWVGKTLAYYATILENKNI